MAGSRGINDPNIKGRLEGGAYPYSTGNINYKNGDLIGYGYSRFTTEYLDDLIENMGREYVDNLLTHQGYETMTDPYSGRELIFKDNNYQKDVLFQTGITHNYDVNVSGGTDKANYYVSMGYIDAEGMVLGTGYDRFSLTANGNYSLRDNLKLSMGVKHSTIPIKVLTQSPVEQAHWIVRHVIRLRSDFITTMELQESVKVADHLVAVCMNCTTKTLPIKLTETHSN